MGKHCTCTCLTKDLRTISLRVAQSQDGKSSGKVFKEFARDIAFRILGICQDQNQGICLGIKIKHLLMGYVACKVDVAL